MQAGRRREAEYHNLVTVMDMETERSVVAGSFCVLLAMHEIAGFILRAAPSPQGPNARQDVPAPGYPPMSREAAVAAPGVPKRRGPHPCPGFDGGAEPGNDRGMETLSSRILLRPSDPGKSQAFYRDVLGLAVYREFGDPQSPGLVFFLGNGLLEVSGRRDAAGPGRMELWLQVRDVQGEYRRLQEAGVGILRPPVQEPWGLVEMWIEDPDGVRIVVVEVPEDHPLRRDRR
jgi:predicted enzyme related to lactoylglutathione lyase